MEDFIPFELAKKLKEKGFDKECLLHYTSSGGFFSNSIDTYDRPNQLLDYSDFQRCFNNDYRFGLIDAPTISQVLKWLREHNIHIVVFINDDTDNPVTYEIYKGTECVMYEHKYYSLSEWNNAEIDAIEYVLDNLI